MYKEFGENPKLCRNCNPLISGKPENLQSLPLSSMADISSKKNMSERKALDLSLYKKSSTFNSEGFVNDLAALSLEADLNKPLHERIVPFTLEVLPDGTVVNRAIDLRDVSEHYSEKTKIYKREKEAGLIIRDALLSEPEGTVSVWLNPPGGELQYQEGRLVIGANSMQNGVKILESYGIPTTFSPEQHLSIALSLARFSERSYSNIHSPEDLRNCAIVFKIPGNSDPWEFLEKYIPTPKAWKSIRKGEAQKLKARTIKDARNAYNEIAPLVKDAVDDFDYTYAGAKAEKLMAQSGRQITNGSCGFTNSSLLGQYTNYLHLHTGLNISGQPLSTTVEGGKYVKRCGNCGKEIKKTIIKGYKCACGGIYEGC